MDIHFVKEQIYTVFANTAAGYIMRAALPYAYGRSRANCQLPEGYSADFVLIRYALLISRVGIATVRYHDDGS
jgi:hypothetical protein